MCANMPPVLCLKVVGINYLYLFSQPIKKNKQNCIHYFFPSAFKPANIQNLVAVGQAHQFMSTQQDRVD